jgi:Secretion system C-terminal sorting domain
MKYFLPILASLILCVQTAQTQNVTISPNPVSKQVHADSADVFAHSVIKNSAATAKTFRWERTIRSVTAGWDIAICDKNLCYLPSVSTRDVVLGAGEEGRMDVHIYPNRVVGAAVVEVKVTEVGNNNNTTTAVYYFNTPVGTKDLMTKASNVRIYPNPVVDHFSILDDNNVVETIAIYNMIGRQVRTFKAGEEAKYNIGDLPDGMYLIRFYSANGLMVKILRINKMRIRA